MKTKLFDYKLPKELIAQYPAQPRDHSRLLVYDREENKIFHDKFYNLKKYLQPGDVLVFNNTKVFPARLILQKPTSGKVEILLLKDLGRGKWECLVGGRIKARMQFSGRHVETPRWGVSALENEDGMVDPPSRYQRGGWEEIICKIEKNLGNDKWLIKFDLKAKEFNKFLEKYGQTPLPLYIKCRNPDVRRGS